MTHRSLQKIAALLLLGSIGLSAQNLPADSRSMFQDQASEYSAVGIQQVTVNDYCVFLNEVATTDTHHLYEDIKLNTEGSTSVEGNENGGVCPIIRSGVSGCYRYEVATGAENDLMTCVSWWDAVRYCNWKENNYGAIAEDPEVTEHGSYQLQGDELLSINEEATYLLASEETENAGSGFLLLSSHSASDPSLKSKNVGFHIMNVAAPKMESKKNIGGLTTFAESLLEWIGAAAIFCGGGEMRGISHEEVLHEEEAEPSETHVAQNNPYQEVDQLWQKNHQNVQNQEERLHQAQQFLNQEKKATLPSETPSAQLSRYAQKFSETSGYDSQLQQSAVETEQLARRKERVKILAGAKKLQTPSVNAGDAAWHVWAKNISKINEADSLGLANLFIQDKENRRWAPGQAILVWQQSLSSSRQQLEQVQSEGLKQLKAVNENFSGLYNQSFNKRGVFNRTDNSKKALALLEDSITASRNIERLQGRVTAEKEALRLLESEEVAAKRAAMVASLKSVLKNKYFVAPALVFTVVSYYLLHSGVETIIPHALQPTEIRPLVNQTEKFNTLFNSSEGYLSTFDERSEGGNASIPSYDLHEAINGSVISSHQFPYTPWDGKKRSSWFGEHGFCNASEHRIEKLQVLEKLEPKNFTEEKNSSAIAPSPQHLWSDLVNDTTSEKSSLLDHPQWVDLHEICSIPSYWDLAMEHDQSLNEMIPNNTTTEVAELSEASKENSQNKTSEGQSESQNEYSKNNYRQYSVWGGGLTLLGTAAWWVLKKRGEATDSKNQAEQQLVDSSNENSSTTDELSKSAVTPLNHNMTTRASSKKNTASKKVTFTPDGKSGGENITDIMHPASSNNKSRGPNSSISKNLMYHRGYSAPVLIEDSNNFTWREASPEVDDNDDIWHQILTPIPTGYKTTHSTPGDDIFVDPKEE